MTSARMYPTTAPAMSATYGVCLVGWVIDRTWGKYPARDSE